MPDVTCLKVSFAHARAIFHIPAQPIVDEIAANLPSLEYLAIGCNRTGAFWAGPAGLISPPLHYMKSFRNLLEVDLDIRLFVHRDHQDLVAPLVDVLPESLRSLLLSLPSPDRPQWPFGKTVKQVMHYLGRNFSAERETKLPRLDSIRFLGECDYQLQEDLLETFSPVEMFFEPQVQFPE
jgi:hypothetical protein